MAKNRRRPMRKPPHGQPGTYQGAAWWPVSAAIGEDRVQVQIRLTSLNAEGIDTILPEPNAPVENASSLILWDEPNVINAISAVINGDNELDITFPTPLPQEGFIIISGNRPAPTVNNIPIATWQFFVEA